MRRATRWTRKMRWNEIARAALILGIVPGYSRGSMFRVADILEQRRAEGKIKKSKSGRSQSAAAYYWASVS